MSLRVAICEDSFAYAHGLQRLLEADGTFEVVAISQDAESLLRVLPQLRPDLVTMDLELGGGLDGAAAIRRIMATLPVPIVVLSAHAGRSGRYVAEALAAGALEAIPKADVRLGAADDPRAAALRRRLARLAEQRATPPPAAAPPSRPVPTAPPPPQRAAPERTTRLRRTSVVGVVASTGGPPALRRVLGALPASYRLPILVVQHISEGFAEGLADWLAEVVPVPVRIAREGQSLAPGVTVAPTGAHLVLRPDRRLHLDTRTAAGLHRPSGDVLLSSLAATAGGGALGVVLTGMGRDGAAGAAAIVAAGGAVWAQRPSESAVWGMPAAAVQAGAEALSLDRIGAGLAALAPGPPGA